MASDPTRRLVFDGDVDRWFGGRDVLPVQAGRAAVRWLWVAVVGLLAALGSVAILVGAAL